MVDRARDVERGRIAAIPITKSRNNTVGSNIVKRLNRAERRFRLKLLHGALILDHKRVGDFAGAWKFWNKISKMKGL